MKDLLSYYNDELVFFSQMARLYAEKYPKTADRLFNGSEATEDPQIDRMIQSFALLTARVSKRLGSNYSQFTESMLESVYPHYLRPIPSYSIVQFGSREKSAGCEAAKTFARATILHSEPVQGVACQFRTAYEVTLAPVIIAQAVYSPFIKTPRSISLPLGITGAISIGFESTGDGHKFNDGDFRNLRVFVDGEPSLCAAVIDALFIRAVGAYVEVGDDDTWLPLNRIPLRLAGLDEADAMIPFTARSHPAFRLLTEYFAYPEKFSFIDFDLTELASRLPQSCGRFTLHLALTGAPNDHTRAQLLAALSPQNFLLGCTPVINLFDRCGVPVRMTHTTADYALLADSTHAFAYEIHTVKSVLLVREQEDGVSGVTEFTPLYGGRYGDYAAGTKGNHWLTRRDETLAELSPGHEIKIALVDTEFDVRNRSNATLSTELTCTNRDLPSLLRYGHPAGDLTADSVPPELPVRMLRKPTLSHRFDAGNGSHWRLISHLSLNYSSLTDGGLSDFQEMLSLYDVARSPTVQRQIGGVASLEHGTVRAWIDTLPVPSLMPGIGIRMTIDEQAFVGSSLFIFAQVMERYFALNRQLNCFTQLEIVSQQSGEEILKCQPRCVEKTRT